MRCVKCGKPFLQDNDEQTLCPDCRAPNLVIPFTIAIDSREQLPFTFVGLRADADQDRRPLCVPLVRATLQSGDYSIEGHESEIAVERKGLADLFGSLGQGRRRFRAEIERLAKLPYASIVIEVDWEEIVSNPPPHSRLPPKSVFRTVLAWQQQFPTVHWWSCTNRRFAEITTFRILEYWWKCRQKERRMDTLPMLAGLRL